MNAVIRFLTIVAVITFSVVPIQAQQRSGVYDYPVKPGTSERKAPTSHDQMQSVCQIPEAIPKNMSTTDLMETCSAYPLYGDIFAFDEFQKGFDWVTSGFNGLQELLKRRDAGTKLIEKYRQMDPEAFDKSWPLVQKGEYAARLFSVEILLAQEEILSNLRKDQETFLVHECIKKAQAKSKYPEVYGILSFGNLGLIAGRIMLRENFAPRSQIGFFGIGSRLTPAQTMLEGTDGPGQKLVGHTIDRAAVKVQEQDEADSSTQFRASIIMLAGLQIRERCNDNLYPVVGISMNSPISCSWIMPVEVFFWRVEDGSNAKWIPRLSVSAKYEIAGVSKLHLFAQGGIGLFLYYIPPTVNLGGSLGYSILPSVQIVVDARVLLYHSNSERRSFVGSTPPIITTGVSFQIE